ncbi:(2Fe-2S)-binding protein [Streptoalloteichus tenebrarius]|nr:(2Fe-2S)-binding protein [Streptoalloteichus tenebrarius]BFF03739.1 hypothetical protein GCM10020241_54140 [Streptoalloteichus tenebrarius]
MPRPLSSAGPDDVLVEWREYCDPDGPWLRACVEEWQRQGHFRHHRAGTVLVTYGAAWLVACATVPEYHFGEPLPSLANARAVIDEHGLLAHLSLTGEDSGVTDADGWWAEVSGLFTPLTEGLAALGGPPAHSDQYWGNAVGLTGDVLRRIESLGAPGDVRATADLLRKASGREHLVSLRDFPDGSWSRRRTCCQWWRSGSGYCGDCVLQDSPSRAR